jgi:uncharacterized phage protein (TIGR01671 family)
MIQYRAWDNVDKKMYYTGEEDNIHFYFDSNGIVAERFFNTIVQTVEGDQYECGDSEVLHHLQYMQYTGLNDKNDNPIYEGDIVKVPSINDHVHGNYSYKEVIYRNGTWIAQYIKSEKGQVVPRGYMAGHLIDCYDHDYKDLVFYDNRLEDTDIEIVGNIYENTDLLDGGNGEKRLKSISNSYNNQQLKTEKKLIRLTKLKI